MARIPRNSSGAIALFRMACTIILATSADQDGTPRPTISATVTSSTSPSSVPTKVAMAGRSGFYVDTALKQPGGKPHDQFAEAVDAEWAAAGEQILQQPRCDAHHGTTLGPPQDAHPHGKRQQRVERCPPHLHARQPRSLHQRHYHQDVGIG